MRRICLAFSATLLLAGCAEPRSPLVHAWAPSAAATRGERIAQRACADCHALGAVGESPAMAAPPFRTIQFRYNAISLSRRMTELAPLEHREMAPLRLDPSEVEDLVAYIQSIEAP